MLDEGSPVPVWAALLGKGDPVDEAPRGTRPRDDGTVLEGPRRNVQYELIRPP